MTDEHVPERDRPPTDGVDEGNETLFLIRQVADGDLDARNLLWSHLYSEVLALAAAQRRRWSGDWTLETRALANEAYIKLFGDDRLALNDRKHFFALVARVVRQVLVNYSEGRRADKRGGGAVHVPLDGDLGIALEGSTSEELLELHEALSRFQEIDERASRVVELRFFAGLNYDEIAETLDTSRATAVRDWQAARRWLNRELSAPRLAEEDDPRLGAETTPPA